MNKFLFLFFIPLLSFGMDAMEARKLSDKNYEKLSKKCSNTAISDLKLYIIDTAKDGRYITSTKIPPSCDYMLVFKEVREYFGKKGFRTRVDITNGFKWIIVDWSSKLLGDK